MKRKSIAAFLLFNFAALSAQARVFSFDERKFSTYLRGTYGTSKLQQQAFSPGFPSSVSFNGTVNSGFSADFGFAFTSPKAFTLRLGVELLYPTTLTGVSGTNSSGAQYMSVDSQVYSVVPGGSVEIFLKKTPQSRFYVGGGSGYAVTTLKNTVTMTSAGTSALGLSNYIEEGTGWGIMGQGFAGWEFSLFDNVSFSFDAGYRYLMVDNFTANRQFTSAAGTFYPGNQIKNADGSNRVVNLSGFFAGAAFRFYIF